jgi:hypothetical protein
MFRLQLTLYYDDGNAAAMKIGDFPGGGEGVSVNTFPGHRFFALDDTGESAYLQRAGRWVVGGTVPTAARNFNTRLPSLSWCPG